MKNGPIDLKSSKTLNHFCCYCFSKQRDFFVATTLASMTLLRDKSGSA